MLHPMKDFTRLSNQDIDSEIHLSFLLVRSMNDSLHQKIFGATSSLFSLERKKKQKDFTRLSNEVFT